MKSFSFRLEQALRWRSVQADLARERVAAAAHRVQAIEVIISHRNTEIADASRQAAEGTSNGECLAIWSAFSDRSRRHVAELEDGRRAAAAELARDSKSYSEAGLRLKLLENLRAAERADWKLALNREQETFADEAYLVRLQLRKRTGA